MNKFPNITSIIVDSPLYSHFDLTDFTQEELIVLLSKESPLRFDSHCPSCNTLSTFIPEKNNDDLFRSIGLTRMAHNNKKSFNEILLEANYIIRVFNCSRFPDDNGHNFIVSFKFTTTGILKIGQYPSRADVTIGGLTRYKKLSPNIYMELNRGNGLISHGIGVGAFVYLRRIIENHIVKPKLEEKANRDGLNMADIIVLDFKSKLTLLKDELPDFLTSNTKIYSIISKGIHELSEDECLRIFPIVLSAIEIILDQEIEIINKKRKMAEIAKQLNAL